MSDEVSEDEDSAEDEETAQTIATPSGSPYLSATPPGGIPPAEERLASEGLGGRLPASFRVRRPVLVPRPLWAVGTLRGRVVSVLGSGPMADLLREEVEARGGRLEGDPDAVIEACEDVLDAFEGARRLAGSPPRDWLCVTRVGASPAGAGVVRASAAGGRAGLAKSLQREWDGCQARVVDVDPALSDAEAVAIACEELSAGDGAIEIYRDGAERRVVELQVEGLIPAPAALAERPVVVVTGGTRGFAARVALEIAGRGPCKLALLARTAPARRPYDDETARKTVIEAIRARGRRPTAGRIERGLAPYRLAEAARLSIQRMREAGADVRFFKVDVSDPDAVAVALDEVRAAFGRIDGVVCGAGQTDVRPLDQKKSTGFRRVFEPRALGGLAVARNLEVDAWFLSLGALAGRFGARDQVDFAAANEAMARLCLARRRALHVSWPPFLGDEPGLDHATPDAAAGVAVDLVAGGVSGELVVCGRLGPYAPLPNHALLDGMELDGDAVTAWRELSDDSDPWLYDYVHEGTPLVPCTLVLEMMAAAAGLVVPGAAYAGARDVRFHTPLKVYASEPVKVIIRATPLGDGRVACSLSSERQSRGSRALVAEHAVAVILLGEAEESEALPTAFFPEESINRSAIYRRLIQGTTFQVLREAGAVAEEGLLADAVAEHAYIAGGLESAPLVLEAAWQAACLHHMAVDGLFASLAGVSRIVLLQTPPDGDALQLMVRRGADSYDIDVDGPEGAVMRVRGLRVSDTGPLPPDDRFPEPEGGWPSAVVGLTLA